MSMLEQEEGDLPADRLEPEGEDWPMDEPEGQALPTDEPGADGFQGSYYLDQFVCWFCLPSVRHISIWLRDNASIEGLGNKKLNLPQLQTPILARSTASAQSIASLLTQTQSLKSLHLGLAYDWHTQTVLEGSEFIAQALESISETIENFSMELEYYPRLNGSPHDDENKTHLLVPFHGILKKIPTPPNSLDTNARPSRLELRLRQSR
ncbi:uncharacterized protein ASPGLDRAFT_1108691 [Aspergillus glaucus CBS 516.65]|uniref:Uncharacterized protein n=1 Tax=Aspergillus glaucus CBS 516.65 TaxID=1160497 RepID=A0A1L9VSP3_ASPGL|nr:hypothetical protein ASPGLDRAFT_1108691 [Aspergillus glaucus CBS 516.65]OJJ86948.1 hypothetical protein ASPGLDRAFT_1108691 [Aspergillus glaucus CBS 516.65]